MKTPEKSMKEAMERVKWIRANPDNPVCEGGCNRRFLPEQLKWPLLSGVRVCEECADDEKAAYGL